MAVLVVSEYGQITCGEKFKPENRVVTESQHRALEKFSEEYKRRFKVTVFRHGPKRSLFAQNYVGVISLGQHQVEILPKIDKDLKLGDDVSQVRHNLARMISVAFDLDIYGDEESNVARHDDSILEIFIRLFCKKLWQCVRRGMVRRYVGCRENLPTLRGRLSITDQIRHNLARPDRLACIFDEFSDNNALNQALKAALRILIKAARSQRNLRDISELMFCFQDVDDVPPNAIDWVQAGTNRLSARYKPVLALARMFIERQSPDVVSGNGNGFSLLFDMNQLFELYVGAMAKRAFSRDDLKVSLQGPIRHLAHNSGGGLAFKLKPDIVASTQHGVAFIIDTKWKRLDEQFHRDGVSSGDMYQMFAYAKQYAAPKVFLLYPHHDKLGERQSRRAEYKLNMTEMNGMDQKICISSVDLRDLNTVKQQLRDLISFSVTT